MFKSTSNSTHFSFTRFARNALPNAAPAPAPISTALPPADLDALFAHQLTQPNFVHLSPAALIHAGITTSPKTAAAIHKALVKNGVLAPQVNTAAVGSGFANQVSMVTSHVQKKIVGVLFAWEGEVGEGDGEGERGG